MIIVNVPSSSVAQNKDLFWQDKAQLITSESQLMKDFHFSQGHDKGLLSPCKAFQAHKVQLLALF